MPTRRRSVSGLRSSSISALSSMGTRFCLEVVLLMMASALAITGIGFLTRPAVGGWLVLTIVWMPPFCVRSVQRFQSRSTKGW